jgi:hypothetical protein
LGHLSAQGTPLRAHLRRIGVRRRVSDRSLEGEIATTPRGDATCAMQAVAESRAKGAPNRKRTVRSCRGPDSSAEPTYASPLGHHRTLSHAKPRGLSWSTVPTTARRAGGHVVGCRCGAVQCSTVTTRTVRGSRHLAHEHSRSPGLWSHWGTYRILTVLVPCC